MNEQLLYEIVVQMTSYAKLEREFADRFYDKLSMNRDIHEEFCKYVDTGYLEGRIKVQGYSVLDLLVQQVNHFKAQLDQGIIGTRENQHQMVLMAFDKLMDMRENPQKYMEKEV